MRQQLSDSGLHLQLAPSNSAAVPPGSDPTIFRSPGGRSHSLGDQSVQQSCASVPLGGRETVSGSFAWIHVFHVRQGVNHLAYPQNAKWPLMRVAAPGLGSGSARSGKHVKHSPDASPPSSATRGYWRRIGDVETDEFVRSRNWHQFRIFEDLSG